jgi:hypothetical protein
VSSEDQIRNLAKKALTATEDRELHRIIEELRSALRKHVERAREIGLATHLDRTPKPTNGGGTG